MEQLTKRQFRDRFDHTKVMYGKLIDRRAEIKQKLIDAGYWVYSQHEADNSQFAIIDKREGCIFRDKLVEFEESGCREIQPEEILNVEIIADPQYTFIPFDKVLVRDNCTERWKPDFYDRQAKMEEDMPQFYTIAGRKCYECIPYEGNEDLALTDIAFYHKIKGFFTED